MEKKNSLVIIPRLFKKYKKQNKNNPFLEIFFLKEATQSCELCSCEFILNFFEFPAFSFMWESMLPFTDELIIIVPFISCRDCLALLQCSFILILETAVSRNLALGNSSSGCFFLCLQASQIGRESEKLPRTCPYGGRKESASGWCFFLWSLSRGFGGHVREVDGLLGDFYSSSLEMCCNSFKLWQLTRTLKERKNTGLASLGIGFIRKMKRWKYLKEK